MSLQTPDQTSAPAGAVPAHDGAAPLPGATSPETEAYLARLVEELTVEEKVSLVVGATAWSTTPIDRIGLGTIRMSDGPVGIRGAGTPDRPTSAMMPAPSALAATWDVDLAARTGALFASEARRHGVHLVLAPQINLQRTPVGGRHFECYSEDPHLTAEIGVALVRAAQAEGVGMCVKHFVANDSETDRTRYLARVDERTLREVYLPPFERVVHEAGAWSVMGAYSGVDDGEVAAPLVEHAPLLRGILKDEWGFDGLVVSDWVATKSIGPAVRAGLDLQMPGPDGVWGDGLSEAVRAGDVAESDLDDKVLRLLRLALRVGALATPGDGSAAWSAAGSTPGDAPRGPAVTGTPGDAPAPQGVAFTPDDAARFLREVAARSVVVLKDDAGAVPLATGAVAGPADPDPAPRPPTVALLGPAATEPFLQGGGSSFVVLDRVTTPAEELRAGLPAEATLLVRPGARARRNPAPLDVAGRVTDPETGAPGVRLDLLAADGTVLDSRGSTDYDGWVHDVRPDADSLRLRGIVALPEPGDHEIGVGTVGIHDVRIDGHVVTAGSTRVDEGIVLSSGHNHPLAAVRAVAGGPADDAERTSGRIAEIDARLQVVHTVGYGHFVRASLVHRLPGPSAADELAAAVEAAARADVAVVVVGTTEEVESEGYDRPDLDLPGNQNELVAAVLAANPRTVVVVNAGAPVILPWYDDAPTVLWAWLAGQEAGTALADVLLGRTEPSGRLPWTLPARAEDVPVPHAIPVDGVVDYAEGLDVGYRAWERTWREPAAPFGHGLGWTRWEYVDARALTAADSVYVEDSPDPGDVLVDVTIRNVGDRPGREVVQVYVEPAETGGGAVSDEDAGAAEATARPVRWLGGFAVVDVPAGEATTVRVAVRARAFRSWDTGARRWVVPGGHVLRVGRSVRDLRLTTAVPR